MKKKSGLILVFWIILILSGCAAGGNEERTFAATAESKTDVDKKAVFPRNLAAYVYPEISWEIGNERPEPAAFFDIESLNEQYGINEAQLNELEYTKFPSDEDTMLPGSYDVIIQAGSMKISGKINVVDTTPPVINAPEEQQYHRGDPIRYKKGVEVTDNSGEYIELSVDATNVYPNMAGTYSVIYEAYDSSGNYSSVESKVTIVDDHTVSEQEVEALADEIISEMVSQDMSKLEQAMAIYDWCNSSIVTTADAPKDDRLYAVYDGLYYREGDCYTIFATASYLLERCGIDTIDLSHGIANGATHYWSLVNAGNGWYHFDASIKHSLWKCFFQTDAQVVEYSEKRYGTPDYYKFDQEDIPERAMTVLFTY